MSWNSLRLSCGRKFQVEFSTLMWLFVTRRANFLESKIVLLDNLLENMYGNLVTVPRHVLFLYCAILS